MIAAILSVQVGSLVTDGDSSPADSLRRKWTTGFYKLPVHSSVKVHRLGLDGDSIADQRHHGGIDKAVLGYGADHYARWRSELAPTDFMDPAVFGTFGPGAFAENLTICGQDEAIVCIGDRYQVGRNATRSLVLEVSQPRQPCWKISRRWQHRTLTKQVAATGRTGWYFRVLREAFVTAGDPITLLERPYPQWPVARANDVLLGRESDRLAVAELMAMDVLAAAWKKSLA